VSERAAGQVFTFVDPVRITIGMEHTLAWLRSEGLIP
jgi:uncharacterized protein (DUF1499 family)